MRHEPADRPRQRRDDPGLVLGVQGMSGGVGASTLTAALAVRAHAAGRSVVAVDGCRWGAGLDLRLGLEGEPGLRWPDLGGLRGEADGAALLAELPHGNGPPVLSWARAPDRRGPTEPWRLLGALSATVELVTCDLPPLGSADSSAWWHACQRIVLLVGTGVDAVGAASAGADLLPHPAGLVLRRGADDSLAPSTVCAALGLPVLAELAHDRRLPGALARGEAVGRSGATARCADDLLAAMLARAAA